MALVFVYGTLTDGDTAGELLPSHTFRGPATLRGLHRVDGAYPTLAPGGEVSGRVLETDHLDALDRYEGVAQDLYARVSLPLAGSAGAVETYVGDPDRLGAAVSWPGDAAFPDCVREYVADRSVRVLPDDGRSE